MKEEIWVICRSRYNMYRNIVALLQCNCDNYL